MSGNFHDQAPSDEHIRGVAPPRQAPPRRTRSRGWVSPRTFPYVRARARGGLVGGAPEAPYGAAAPWFYEGRRGTFARQLERLAKRARAKKLGLWGACPRTQYDPYSAIETRR